MAYDVIVIFEEGAIKDGKLMIYSAMDSEIIVPHYSWKNIKWVGFFTYFFYSWKMTEENSTSSSSSAPEDSEFYLRYYVGHNGRYGHEFLEFELLPDGKLRYGNNSSYKRDGMIRKHSIQFICIINIYFSSCFCMICSIFFIYYSVPSTMCYWWIQTHDRWIRNSKVWPFYIFVTFLPLQFPSIFFNQRKWSRMAWTR